METQQIPLIKKSSSYKITIPDNVEDIIRYTCQKIHDVEWSGVLFYTTEGSFENNDLNVICKDIYIMDIGSSAYTEFDMTPDVVGYMAENPELFNYYTALIHSHNNMATFFSGTDLSTLKEEGLDRDHFVSLIVNNAGTYTAAITRLVESEKEINENYSYKTFNDEIINNNVSYKTKTKELHYFDLQIIKNNKNNNDLIDKRLEEIKAEKNKAKTTTSTSKQLYLDYDEYKYNNVLYKASKLYKEPEEDSKYSEDYIKYLVLQILTGSVAVSKNNINKLEEWAGKCNTIFESRFGKEGYKTKAFKEWAELYIDFLLGYNEDNNTYTKQSDIYEKVYAVQELLESYPKNEYIKYFIQLLKEMF